MTSMKQWTVTYCDKNDSKASVVIEAEDRASIRPDSQSVSVVGYELAEIKKA